MKHAKYIGSLSKLKNMTALIQDSQTKGYVLAQFDGKDDWRLDANFPVNKLRHPLTGAFLCVNWHEFNANDFEEIEQ